MKTERGNSFTLNKLSEKEMKNLEILELIRKKVDISRADISKITNINIVSTCSYIKSYIDNKLIFEKGFDVSTGGRKPELVELNTKENFVIGLDVSPNEIKGILVNFALNVIGKTSTPVKGSGPKAVTEAASTVISELSKNSGSSANNVRAIGIGAAELDPSVLRNLAQEFGINIFIGSPATVAASGERYLNPAVSSDNFLYIFSSLGRGVIVKKEELFEDSYSEETKYLRPWNESLGIVEETKREVAKGVGTVIVDLVKADLGSITEDTVIEASKKNDEVALGVIQSVAASLGVRIAYLVNLFSPAVVVLGGGLQKSGVPLLESIRKAVKKLSVKKLAEIVDIIPSAIGEEAVRMGAASLAVRETFLRV